MAQLFELRRLGGAAARLGGAAARLGGAAAQLSDVAGDAAEHFGEVATGVALRVGEAAAAPLLPWLPGDSVDDWGRDPHLIRALSPFAKVRWHVTVGGQHHLPTRSGALLVANARRWSLSSLYASWALSEATGRPVRFVGRPDTAPIGPLMRRFGALLTDPDEVGSALRNDQLVLISAASTAHARHAGRVDHELIAAAVLSSTPVFPVATMSNPVGRPARVEVGAVVRQRRGRRGPLAEVELAEQVQRRVQKLLEEMGGYHTGLRTIDWWGEG